MILKLYPRSRLLLMCHERNDRVTKTNHAIDIIDRRYLNNDPARQDLVMQ